MEVRASLLPLPLLLAVSGCFYPDTLDELLEGHRCDADADCVGGWTCDVEEGVCVEGDAPPVDGGAVDAGPEDAGFDAGADAGPADAGFDAGPPPNNAPTLGSPGTTVNGVSVELRIAVTDPDASDDTVELRVDWGDGSAVQVVDPAAADGSPTTLVHDYNRIRSYSGTVVAIDDGGAGSMAANFAVTTVAPTDGLLVHMKLDGDLTDEQGNAFTSSGAVSYQADRFNMSGRSLDLWHDNDTSNPLLTTPNLSAMSGSFSIGIWVNQVFDSFQSSNVRIVGQGDWMNLFSPSAGMKIARLDGTNVDAAGPSVGAADLPNQDQWTFYVGVVERDSAAQSTIRLYRNANLIQEMTYNGELPNPGGCRFYVGGFPDGDLCTGTQQDQFGAVPAYVDDLRVYARPLESWEVAALYFDGNYTP